ncbi:hypothetical protein JTB14_018401 [Gonioctena quinquepunctata]|nr:hypothetical protein JTB14_018401 [Gonioctena quinquepunctata]
MGESDVLAILKDIQQTNRDIREDIEDIKVENDNKVLEERLKLTERKIKRKNIVIFGIPEEENPLSYFQDVAEQKLDIQLGENEINNINRMGVKSDKKPRPVLLELTRNIKKVDILNNPAKFKGSLISITNDLTEEYRLERKFLYKHFKIAKENSNQSKIRAHKLIVNGEVFTYQQLESKEEEEESNQNKNIQPNPKHIKFTVEETALEGRPIITGSKHTR